MTESGAYHEISMGSQSRQQKFEQTSNSYAKQMQNPDDTQYKAAIMREARQQHMMMEAARSAAQSTSGEALSEVNLDFDANAASG